MKQDKCKKLFLSGRQAQSSRIFDLCKQQHFMSGILSENRNVLKISKFCMFH